MSSNKIMVGGLKKKTSISKWSFSAYKDEMKKVTWTSKKELVSGVKLVVLSVCVFGLSVYAVDLSLQWSIKVLAKFF